jgi:guanine deaminase
MLGEQTIMGHCIHLSDDEIALLADSRTNVAFCPCSNRALRSGEMPYTRLRRAALKIALGSDIAGGPSLSMFRQMGEALNSANINGTSLSVDGALYLATLAGAEVLGLKDRIGNFMPGKDADFVVIDHKRADSLTGTGRYNAPDQILSRLCYKGDFNCVRQVYIQGVRQL